MKTFRFFGLFLGLTFCVFGGALAQEKYPNRPIELVVPWAPGGSSDITARIYSEEMARVLKTPVTVVNRAGGAGANGTIYVTKAKKDGYTLTGGAATPVIISPSISKDVPPDLIKDLFPLGHFASVPTVFAVRSDSPFQTLNDLIEYARKNPGKLKNGVGGLGTESHFNMEILCARNNIKITTIPYKSGGEAMPAILGGHIDLSSNSGPTTGPHIKSGKLRGLAITSKTRDLDLSNIPTTVELGYPYVNLVVRIGVFAPAGVPQSILDILISAIEKAFKNPDVIKRATNASTMVEYMGPEEFGKLIESDMQAVAKVARDIGMSRK